LPKDAAVARAQSSQQSSSQPSKVRGVPVTVRALEQRIARLLATEGKQLKRTKGEIALRDLGPYYVLHDNSVTPIDLEKFGRELRVLKRYEHLIAED
jgi:hypothetical protein